jgi:hypothetical protein
MAMSGAPPKVMSRSGPAGSTTPTRMTRSKPRNNSAPSTSPRVGRGANLILNVPPDRRGQLHANDVESLRGFGAWLTQTFGRDLARTAHPSASNVRGAADAFSPRHLLDGDAETYWATDDEVTTPELVLEFGEPVTFNIVRLREYLPLGQRIDDWALDVWQGANGRNSPRARPSAPADSCAPQPSPPPRSACASPKPPPARYPSLGCSPERCAHSPGPGAAGTRVNSRRGCCSWSHCNRTPATNRCPPCPRRHVRATC